MHVAFLTLEIKSFSRATVKTKALPSRCTWFSSFQTLRLIWKQLPLSLKDYIASVGNLKDHAIERRKGPAIPSTCRKYIYSRACCFSFLQVSATSHGVNEHMLLVVKTRLCFVTWASLASASVWTILSGRPPPREHGTGQPRFPAVNAPLLWLSQSRTLRSPSIVLLTNGKCPPFAASDLD